jgi:hypothetical protein
MTDAEFNEIMEETRAHVARTSFPAPAPRETYEAHGHHAESQSGTYLRASRVEELIATGHDFGETVYD